MDALVFIYFNKTGRFAELIDTCLFAHRIGSLRRAAALTQRDLARVCGVTSQAVSKWERGISCPDIQILDELAYALDVSLEELLLPQMSEPK